MSDSSRDGLAAWLIDGAAAGIAGAAVGWSVLVVVGQTEALVAGVAVLLAAMLGLRLVQPEPRRFKVPAFELPDVAVDAEILELTELEPLLLQDALPEPEPHSRVVQLFPRQAVPTAGELKARIDAHLERQPRHPLPPGTGGEVVSLPVDASAALRAAIADLRRSLA